MKRHTPRRLVPLVRTATLLLTLTGEATGDSTALSRVGTVRWLANGGLLAHDPGGSRLLVFDSAARYARQVSRNESDVNDISPMDAWAWQDSLVVVMRMRSPPPPPLLPGRTVGRWPTMMSLALRNDHAVVVKRDSLDVEYVAVHPIVETPP